MAVTESRTLECDRCGATYVTDAASLAGSDWSGVGDGWYNVPWPNFATLDAGKNKLFCDQCKDDYDTTVDGWDDALAALLEDESDEEGGDDAGDGGGGEST